MKVKRLQQVWARTLHSNAAASAVQNSAVQKPTGQSKQAARASPLVPFVCFPPLLTSL